MRRQIILQLYVELHNTVHGNGDGYGVEARHPNVRIPGVFRARTVATLRLCDNGYDSEEWSNEAVLEDANPDNLRSVSQATSQSEVYVR